MFCLLTAVVGAVLVVWLSFYQYSTCNHSTSQRSTVDLKKRDYRYKSSTYRLSSSTTTTTTTATVTVTSLVFFGAVVEGYAAHHDDDEEDDQQHHHQHYQLVAHPPPVPVEGKGGIRQCDVGAVRHEQSRTRGQGIKKLSG